VITGGVSADTEAAKTVTATCTGGTKVIGGGFEFSSVSDASVMVLSSYPTSATVWSVSTSDMTQGGDHSYAVRAYAVCANIAP
jgi:hypothetical protein